MDQRMQEEKRGGILCIKRTKNNFGNGDLELDYRLY